MNEDIIVDNEQSVPSLDGINEDVAVDSSQDPAVSVEESVYDGENEGQQIEEEQVVYEYKEYTVDDPLPVYIVSDGSEEVEEEEEQTLEVRSSSGSYAGTISDTYLDYFRGITEKLKPNEHYVVWRSGQYSYTLAYGEDVSLSDGMFIGNCDYVEIYRNSSSYSTDWYVEHGTDSLALDAEKLFIYSDLGMFSRLERGLRYGEEMAILFAFGVATVFVLSSRIFDYIVKYVYRR